MAIMYLIITNVRTYLNDISKKESKENVEKEINGCLPPNAANQIEIIQLTDEDYKKFTKEHGLLFLPKPYVVPGGRFNEMYGWDSYFINIGLLRSGHLQMAKDMIENQVYQIEHYRTVLNANRTYLYPYTHLYSSCYYLKRSQPPYLSCMIIEYYEKTKDKAWLAQQVNALEEYYRFYTTEPHLVRWNEVVTKDRYFALGEGPCVEVLYSEISEGKNHYERVKEYYAAHKDMDFGYDTKDYFDESGDLTALFYKGDRSMREAGYDPSCRFGQFNVDVIRYAPICLNSLLYKMEKDLAAIYDILGRDSQIWKDRAQRRKDLVNQYCFDETAGLYFDYNYKTQKRRKYPFATVFYPLWAGIATEEHAKRIVENLSLFEKDGGIVMSTNNSGCQWDWPYGWAPLQWLAVKGLLSYHYTTEAHRIARKFVDLVVNNFQKDKGILEKYDVVHCTGQVQVGFGYLENEIGFGWTNAIVLEFLHLLEAK